MLKGTVSQITNGAVAVALSNGQTFNAPAEDFEGTPTVGSTVHVILVAPGSEDAGRQKFAKEILNEVMGGGDGSL